jgi:hypothetical protein
MTSHPHALLLRSGDFVSNPFTCNLSLELGKGEQDVQRQPSHGCRRIKLLGDRDEADTLLIEGFNDPGKIR